MQNYAIELEQVSCKVGYRYLLKDINWQVKPGEHWVVFGMNGSGKTTLLSMIAGFQHYTSGSVKLWGEPFSNETILDMRKRIGWVSASFFDRYYSKESALNIVLSGKFGTLGLENDITLEDVDFAKSLFAELRLANKENRPFDMLSKGERQNVLIARALFSNPDILILDEPCTGLDVYNRSYLFDTLNALSKRKNFSIVYVTHYVEEILPIFEKILLLKNGRVFAQGATKDMLTQTMMSDLLGYPVEIGQEQDNTYRLHVRTKSDLMQLLEKAADTKKFGNKIKISM